MASTPPSLSASATETSENPESSPIASSKAPSGLDMGQKVGIGVGGAIAWFTLMGLAFWFWWRRRSSRQNAGFELEKPNEGVAGISSDGRLSTGPEVPRELEMSPEIMPDSKQNLDSGSWANGKRLMFT
ncbi:MAG: hypothetical protein Q9226_007130 [Calogaya cf. arnoldii]